MPDVKLGSTLRGGNQFNVVIDERWAPPTHTPRHVDLRAAGLKMIITPGLFTSYYLFVL
jgi:hypothetical protein